MEMCLVCRKGDKVVALRSGFVKALKRSNWSSVPCRCKSLRLAYFYFNLFTEYIGKK